MAILTEGEEILLPNGVRSWSVDIGAQIGQPAGRFFIQIVDLPDDAARELGAVSVSSGNISISGQPINVEIQTQPVDVEINTQPIAVVDTWDIQTIADEVLNDSDKVIAVPADEEYQILWIWVELTTDANAGNRQLQIDFRDVGLDVVGQVRPGIVQAASLTRYYMFAPALADLAAFRDTDYLMTPLPPTVFLPTAYSVRIFDNNAVSAAGDDMIVQMQVAWKPA